MTRDIVSAPTPDTAKQLRHWLDGIPAARTGALAAVSAAMAEQALTDVGLLKTERVTDDSAESCSASTWMSDCRPKRWPPAWA